VRPAGMALEMKGKWGCSRLERAIQMVTDKPIIDPSGRSGRAVTSCPEVGLGSNAAEAGGAYAWLSHFY